MTPSTGCVYVYEYVNVNVSGPSVVRSSFKIKLADVELLFTINGLVFDVL